MTNGRNIFGIKSPSTMADSPRDSQRRGPGRSALYRAFSSERFFTALQVSIEPYLRFFLENKTEMFLLICR